MTLHACLRNPSRAVLQFYPSSDDQVRSPSLYPPHSSLTHAQVQLVTQAAQRAGFGGGIVVDYPNSRKARKVFLVLYVGDGGASTRSLPQGLDGDEPVDAETVKNEKKRLREGRRLKSKKGKKDDKGGKDWILRKKELYRKRGKEDVPKDSKYTGRRRKAVF